MGALDLVVKGRGTDVIVQMGAGLVITLLALSGFTVYRVIKDGPRKVFAGVGDEFKEMANAFKRPHQL